MVALPYVNRIIRRLLFFTLSLIILGCSSKNTPDNYVVIVSLDAFRWDYPAIANTPNLNAIAANGIKAEAFIPCYPTKTFPNHYSMATGLHPNNHGIVCNSFLDTAIGYYGIRNRDAVENPSFYGGEPIWLTAQRQGLIAATYFWVGSEAPIGGTYPTYWKRYDSNISFESKIDTAIFWLSQPMEKRPRLVMLYSSEPDGIAHKHGSIGVETISAVEQLDSLLGIFLEKLSLLPHANRINLLVVSDHGMTDIFPERYINLNDYINRDWFSVITGGNPVYSLQPKEEYREQAIVALKSIPNLKVWERNEIPERYHYGTNPRIQDILIEAEIGFSVGLSYNVSRYSGATHGYDNLHPDMYGIFYAQGPAFKKGYKHKAFMNTNLYTIITHILGLKPAKTDGDWKEVKNMFR